jgi:hypothetical protein
MINIVLLTYKEEQFGVRYSFDRYLHYYYNGDMRQFLADRSELEKGQKIKILLAGRLQIPSLICLKDMYLPKIGKRVMQVAFKLFE